MKRPTTRVVVVDASPTEAAALRRAMEVDGDIEVVGTARDASSALAQVLALRPDVVTVDNHIPAGGGPAVVNRVMREVPTPILIVAPAPEAVEALAAGAVEAIPKPGTWTAAAGSDLRRMVRRVRDVPVIGRRGGARSRPADPPDGSTPTAPDQPARGAVVGIAASTGGPAAVATVLSGLVGCPAPLLVVQHIHPSFADGFADWLSSASGHTVSIARDGQQLVAGRAYVAPGDRHLLLSSRRTITLDEQPESLHRPSADVLFQSLAREAGAHAVGVVLTGMGADGAHGLSELRAAGGRVLAQDQATSVVFGMPQAAMRSGAVDHVLPLEEMAGAIRAAVRTSARSTVR